MKLSAGKIDPVALEQGAWVTDIPDMGELKLRVRGANNADWRELERKLIQNLPREKKIGGMIEQKDQDHITSECLFRAGLLDWDGFEDDEEKPIPYSKELARDLCFKPEYMRYRLAMLWACNVVAERKQNGLDDIVGN